MGFSERIDRAVDRDWLEVWVCHLRADPADLVLAGHNRPRRGAGVEVGDHHGVVSSLCDEIARFVSRHVFRSACRHSLHRIEFLALHTRQS